MADKYIIKQIKIPATSVLSVPVLTTKEVIFGNYSHKVSVTRVYVKYIAELDTVGIGSDSDKPAYGLKMQFTTNGGSSLKEFSSPIFPNSTTVSTATFTPASGDAKNIHSIRFHITGCGHTDASSGDDGLSRSSTQILQIGVIYKAKTVR
jgi:hypothetical protein|tara:strand:- start:772 stop:1221 length:450 start_codon:yes stop_codon:yes gene_type:complete